MAAEGVAFREAYSCIAEALEHQASPIALARKLYSQRVITRAVKNRIGSGSVSREVDVEILLRAVETSIQTKPSHFNVFVKCLSEEPVFSEVVEELEKRRSEAAAVQRSFTKKKVKQRENATGGKPDLRIFIDLVLVIITVVTMCILLSTNVFNSDHLHSPKNPQYPLAHYKGRLVQHDLPVPPKPFIGRNRELEQITTLFHSNKKDVISIHGPPAFGKSALAIHVGYSVLHLGMDVRYIDVSETPHLLQNKISFELALCFEQDATNNLIDWVRTLRYTTLLILDELDDILAHNREEFEDLIRRLCQAAPPHTLKILITSQSHIMFLDRFQQFFIGKLDPIVAVELLNELTDINVSVNDSQRLAELVGFCPLTIKVVAALLNKPGMEGSAWLLAVLEKNIISTSCLDETLAINHCWKAVMDIAYNKLSEEGQICGHFVALFPGSFTEYAVNQILTAPNCPKNLVVTSLVQRYTRNNRVRYIMHKLVKDYFRKNTDENIRQKFEAAFLVHYSELVHIYRTLDRFTNIEPAEAEEYHYYFAIESHNWEELVRIALATSSVSDTMMILSVAFIHYKGSLPRDVSWLKLFHIYNTQSFENACELLGDRVCSEILIQTVESIHETMPLVSCSLVYALKNRGLLLPMKHYISSSLCYCETQMNVMIYCIIIPYRIFFVKCILDIFITYLPSINDKYLHLSQLVIHSIFGYFTVSSMFFYVFMHPLTILLCYMEQHIAPFSQLFICTLSCGGCMYISYRFMLQRFFKKPVYYSSLMITIISQTFVFAYNVYVHYSLPTYNRISSWAISCYASIACLYFILLVRDELTIQLTHIHRGHTHPGVIPEGSQLVHSFRFLYPIHIRLKNCWFVMNEVFLLFLLWFALTMLVVYIFGYTSYYPFLY